MPGRHCAGPQGDGSTGPPFSWVYFPSDSNVDFSTSLGLGNDRLRLCSGDLHDPIRRRDGPGSLEGDPQVAHTVGHRSDGLHGNLWLEDDLRGCHDARRWLSSSMRQRDGDNFELYMSQIIFGG